MDNLLTGLIFAALVAGVIAFTGMSSWWGLLAALALIGMVFGRDYMMEDGDGD